MQDLLSGWCRRKFSLAINQKHFISAPPILLILLLSSYASFTQDAQSQNDKAIIDWVQQNAISLKHVEAGNGFSDLQPLKKIWQNVKVVGLGEATHATREFFQVKHRLFEFLVREMNFNSFALEASTASCEPINDFVLYGNGDRASVLTGQGYSLWDTEEFADLIDWMRNYNKAVPENKKVRFYGLDVAYNKSGRENVLSFLRQHAPQEVSQANFIFDQLEIADEKWPMRIGEFKEEAEELLPQLQNLAHYLNSQKNYLISVSSPAEFMRIVNYTKIMEQFIRVIISYPLRTRYMAENLLALMQENPNARFIVSAHNRHINVKDHMGDTNLGHDLREGLGDQYYAVLFETYQGTYQTRRWDPKRLTLSDFLKVALPPTPNGSLSWFLTKANMRDHFLDLRRPFNNVVVDNWLNTPQVVTDIQWIDMDESTIEAHLKVNVKSYYDGILFIKNTTRARPTKNAIQKATGEIGF